MKKLNYLITALGLLLVSSVAEAQTSRNPCYTTGATTTQGILNCIGVGTNTPLPTMLYANGVGPAQISLDGALSVNTPASPQFADSFSAALDTTTNWTAKNSTGTAATSAGQLVINSSTTASAWGGVSSQQSFAPVGVSPQVWGVLASFTVLAQANSVRVFGMFTVPGTPTTTVPVTDGYIFRLDGTGKLFAEIWSSGAAVSSTDVTTACLPAANFPGIFAINYRASLVQFTCGSSTVVNQAPILGINPVQQVLPVSALSIAGSTPPAASAVMNLSAIALAAISPGTVKSANQFPTINDPTTVVAVSPNSATGYSININTTPTVQNAAYASGNAIGGLQTISFFRNTSQASGILNNVSVASQGGATAALTLYVFKANPTASTCTDKTAFVLNSADVSKLITTIPIVLTPGIIGVGSTVTFASQQSTVAMKNADTSITTNIYACAVTAGYTPATVSDLVFEFAGVQD